MPNIHNAKWRAVCFREDWNHVQYDKTMTRETKLRNSLAHIFDGIRHEGEGPDAEYMDEWIARLAIDSMVDAAVVLCMRDDDFRVRPALQEQLVKSLTDIKKLSLEELRKNNQVVDGLGLLDSPPLYQLLVAAAFEAGNRPLVRDMISGVEPPEGAPILFSGIANHLGTFAGRKGFGHGGLDGQDDNGCDLVADLITARWAVPHEQMKSWTIYAHSQASAKALIDVLVQHGFKFDDLQISACIGAENMGMLEFALEQRRSTLISEGEQFDLLKYAASVSSPSRIHYLDVLWNHGVRALNWRIKTVPLGIRGREDVSWDCTPLHVAVYNDDAEAVEWFLKRGAKAFRDQDEKSPFEYAQERGVQEVLDAFGRYPGFKNNDPLIEYKMGFP